MTLSRLPWDEQKKIAAWTVCDPVPGLPPVDWRIDAFGRMIRRADHGKKTEHGWEIDHVRPLAVGGPDSLDNLRALHWRKNRQLGGLLGNAMYQTGGLLDLPADTFVNPLASLSRRQP